MDIQSEQNLLEHIHQLGKLLQTEVAEIEKSNQRVIVVYDDRTNTDELYVVSK